MDITQIILGCKKQDRKCQKLLVDSYAPRLLAICRRYCQSVDMAHDALQECFLSTFKYLDSYNSDGNFDAWIKKIAVNSSIMILRKYKNISYQEDNEIEKLLEAQVPEAFGSMQIDEILKLLDKLPPSLSTVFNLNIIEGYKHDDIANILNITASTSRSHLNKARFRLISLMHDHGFDVPEHLIENKNII